MEGDACRDPGRDQLSEVAGLDQEQDGCKRQAKPAGECALPRLSVEVGTAVAHHDPADERDEQKHRRAHGVEAGGEPDADRADKAGVARSREDEEDNHGDGDQQGQEGGGLGGDGHQRRTPPRPEECGNGGEDQRQRRSKRDEIG